MTCPICKGTHVGEKGEGGVVSAIHAACKRRPKAERRAAADPPSRRARSGEARKDGER